MTWETDRYFKESAENINVLLSPKSFSSAASGGSTRFIHELNPTSVEGGIHTIYYASLTPDLLYEAKAGAYELVVLENYQAYGVSWPCTHKYHRC